MHRVALLVTLAAWISACSSAKSDGSPESQVTQTEVIDPASVPPPTAPEPRKVLPTDPPAPPPIIPDAAPAPTTPATPTPAAKAKAGELELLGTGDEPRFALRYQFTEGAGEALAMTTEMTMTMSPEPPVLFPETVVEASVAAISVDADGTMSLEITLTGADAKDVDGSKIPAAQVKAQMGDVVGMKTTILVDAHGHMTDEHGAAIQQIEQTQMGFNQLAAALPIEPIGKGAKWRIKQHFDQGELKIDQVMTFEVIAVTATTAKLRSTGKLTAPPQTIDWQGQKVDLEKTTGTSQATMTIDFARLVPDVRGTVEMTMRMNGGGEKATMTTKSVMSMHAK
jgi:hypothetical protein